MATHQWLLKRNCALTPRQLGSAYLALFCLSLLVALVFTLRGAWFILAFSLAEMLIVGGAFLYYARHATDREHILLDRQSLVVSLIQAEQERQTRLDPLGTRITLPKRTQDLIGLENRGIALQVGRFVSGRQRRQVAEELRQQLACLQRR